MKVNLIKGKSTRTKVFTAISAAAIVLILALNYLFTYLVSKNALYIDLTPESLYTLSEEMKSECAFIDKVDDGEKQLEITFCADPDTLISNTVTRVPYFMALQMQSEFDNLKVETVNVVYNPTALARFKTTSLTAIEPSDVIISYGDVYRIISAESFWMKTSEQTYFSYNGEYKMASLIMSVMAKDKPAAYFTTGHGETYYDVNDPENATNVEAAALYDLLSQRGYKVGTIDLLTEEIPEDCALLIINNPTSDFVYDKAESNSLYYISETKKIDRYLRKKQGALMVARDYESTSLTNLDSFLYNWGFSFGNALVTDNENHIGSENDKIIGVYETNTDSYANAIYGEFAGIPSAPLTIFDKTGYIECSFYETDSVFESGSESATLTYNSFMTSYKSAVATNSDGVQVKEDKYLDLAAVTVRYNLDDETAEAEYSYVFCANSKDFFSNELLYSTSYANFDIVCALVNNIARTDVYASMTLGGTSLNSPKYGGKQIVYDTLSQTAVKVYNGDASYKMTVKALTAGAVRAGIIISVTVPLVILAVGVVIRVKRKYL